MAAKARRTTLTEGTLRGLAYIQQYRFLTIAQFARIAGISNYHAGQVLQALETRQFVGYFGFTVIPGHGKTPKAYYLKRRGFEALILEGTHEPEELGPFSEVGQGYAWSPQMYHRLRLLDLFISLELQVADRPHLQLVRTLVEYRCLKGSHARETSDYVAEPAISENRIVPDGAFILANAATGRRALFFVEMDMGTERITAPKSHDQRATIIGKFRQYDRYLTGGKFAQTYTQYGEFRAFLLLFVTIGQDRMTNIRAQSAKLPEQLHGYYRLAEFDAAVKDFLGPVWLSRDLSNTAPLALVGA
jgi:hypothetical protein